jgi:uncharacterized SAM-binding protein YcdF (DUF218 family)
LGPLVVFLVEGEAFLKVSSDLHGIQADAIVVLAGAAGEDNLRVAEGNALFRRGIGKYLILPLRHPAFKWRWAVETYNLSNPVHRSKILIGRALKDEKQIIYDYGGTYLEALKTIQIMKRRQLRSAIIISSAYHMRRVRVAFKNADRQNSFTFYYHPVENNKPEGSVWWVDYDYFKHILQEYRKLIAAYFVYRK